jgi:hypothetical protein
LNRRLIGGLRPAAEFERLAEQVSQAPSRRLLAASN